MVFFRVVFEFFVAVLCMCGFGVGFFCLIVFFVLVLLLRCHLVN